MIKADGILESKEGNRVRADVIYVRKSKVIEAMKEYAEQACEWQAKKCAVTARDIFGATDEEMEPIANTDKPELL